MALVEGLRREGARGGRGFGTATGVCLSPPPLTPCSELSELVGSEAARKDTSKLIQNLVSERNGFLKSDSIITKDLGSLGAPLSPDVALSWDGL